MPVVNLKFKLPEEQDEYDQIMAAGKMHSCLYDLYQFLRADSKYGEEKYADVYAKFWEILNLHDYDIFG